MEKRYYAAYGSNLNIEQMKMRCKDARAVGTSWIPDYELLFKGSQTGAYLTIEQKVGSKVPVGIWEVSQADEKALDYYEGYPRFYYKTEMELPIQNLQTGKTRTKKIFVYIMHEDRKIGVPSDFYIQTCLRGYADFGFDESYLLKAQNGARKNAKRSGFVWDISQFR